MRSFAARRSVKRFDFLTAGPTLAGCAARRRDDLTDPAHETPPPVQWKAGEGSRVLAFSPDGRTLVTGDRPHRYWDVATGKQRFQQLGGKSLLAFSPDGLKLGFQDYRNL